MVEKRVDKIIEKGKNQIENEAPPMTCTYTYKDDVENRHKNLSWKWELPPFLTKYPQVFKCIIRLIILPAITNDISHL